MSRLIMEIEKGEKPIALLCRKYAIARSRTGDRLRLSATRRSRTRPTTSLTDVSGR